MYTNTSQIPYINQLNMKLIIFSTHQTKLINTLLLNHTCSSLPLAHLSCSLCKLNHLKFHNERGITLSFYVDQKLHCSLCFVLYSFPVFTYIILLSLKLLLDVILLVHETVDFLVKFFGLLRQFFHIHSREVWEGLDSLWQEGPLLCLQLFLWLLYLPLLTLLKQTQSITL